VVAPRVLGDDDWMLGCRDQVRGRFELRGVGRGHPLFGPACELIRAEALVRLTSEPPLPSGLLALGQRNPQSFDTRHGSELLIFLGRVLTRCMGRWLIP